MLFRIESRCGSIFLVFRLLIIRNQKCALYVRKAYGPRGLERNLPRALTSKLAALVKAYTPNSLLNSSTLNAYKNAGDTLTKKRSAMLHFKNE